MIFEKYLGNNSYQQYALSCYTILSTIDIKAVFLLLFLLIGTFLDIFFYG